MIRKLITCLTLLFLGLLSPAIAVAPVQQAATFQILAALGLISQTNQNLLNFQIASGTLCSFGERTVITVAGTTTGYAVNLSTLFPGVTNTVAITVHDITNPGQAVAFSPNSTGTRLQLAGGGAMALTSVAAPPTIYFDNSNTGTSYIEISILGN